MRCLDAGETGAQSGHAISNQPKTSEYTNGRTDTHMTIASKQHEVDPERVHLKYAEAAQYKSVYAFSSQQGVVYLEGIRCVPRGV